MPGNTRGIALHSKAGKKAKPVNELIPKVDVRKHLKSTNTSTSPTRLQHKAIYRSALASARSRMRLIINLGQMLKIKVRVNLSRRDIGMTQQFLHRT